MRAPVLAGLVVAGVVALAGGWYFGAATAPSGQVSVPGGTLMFPGLAQALGGVATIEIVHQDKTLVIGKRAEGGWGVASLRLYPVQETKLRGMLTALTELRLMEPRTSDPASLGRLGLDDPAGAASTASLLRLLDGGGKPVAEVVVGHRRVRTQGNGREDVYVRRPGDNQAWLAEGSLQVDTDSAQWLDRSVLDIGHAKLARVEVGDGALVFAPVDGKLALIEPAEHPTLDDYKVEDVGRALELLTLQAVKPDAELVAEEAGHSVFSTAEGLAVTVRVLRAGTDVWARFSAAGPGAEALNARLGGWSYQIGSWKQKALVPVIADLAAEAPAAAATEAPAAAGTEIPASGAPR
jgi:hypothetical protein